MINDLSIRPETKSDFDTLYDLVKAAFATARLSDGDEQNFMVRLREGAGYLPELALTAELDGRLIGHIMLTRTEVTTENGEVAVLLLAPLSVLPEYQNKGVGGALAKAALSKARELGHRAVFLVGHKEYYSRFGFVPASGYGIKCQLDIPEDMLDNVMALELIPNALEGVSGTVRF